MDMFRCLVELIEHFPLAEARSPSRPLLYHIPLVWAGNEGIGWSTYFKMDKSWLQEVEFKEEVKAWRAQSRRTS